tara:strand:+ start:7127 stop:8269 length:1143 start_codon:yes stop_codon:yes gene_type:complete
MFNEIKSRNSAYNEIKKNKGQKELLIFHAASAGEFEQLKPILLKIDRKKYFVLQTFFSPTIYNKEHKNSLFDTCCYHPFDLPSSALLFFKRLKPKKYIITRHDIWPNHIILAKLLGISTILINANMYQSSLRLKPIIINLNKFIFNQFDKILTGSIRMKNLLSHLADKNKIIITGDSRFDQVLNRKHNNKIKTFVKWKDDKTIIFGSIDNHDIKIIDTALSTFDCSKLKLIIVPHEITNSTIKLIQNMLLKYNITFSMYSNFDYESQCCIVDYVGILADLYKYSTLAYIGGGFSEGVHSVIEPAIYYNLILHGPNIDILDEAIDLNNNNISIMVKNSQQLLNSLKLIRNDKELNEKIDKIKKYMKSQKNSSNNIINELFN